MLPSCPLSSTCFTPVISLRTYPEGEPCSKYTPCGNMYDRLIRYMLGKKKDAPRKRGVHEKKEACTSHESNPRVHPTLYFIVVCWPTTGHTYVQESRSLPKSGTILNGIWDINISAVLHGAGLRNHRIWQYFAGLVWARSGYRYFHGINLGGIGVAQFTRAWLGGERDFLFFTGPRDHPESREIPR